MSTAQYSAQNGSNPLTQIWVETGQINGSNNRFTSGMTYDDAGNVTNDTKFRNKRSIQPKQSTTMVRES
jgi:hypothetical protein